MSLYGRKTVMITMTGIFSSLSFVLGIFPLSFPFPLLPYLKFDLAEFPILILTYIVGPSAGFISSIALWLALNLAGSFVPIGPLMKFFAAASTILGIWIGTRFSKKIVSVTLEKCFAISLIFACFIRILVMGFFNAVVLLVLFPEFLSFAAKSLSISIGLNLSGQFETFLWAMFFTGIFNSLHVIFSMIPSFYISKVIWKTLNLSNLSWISRETGIKDSF